MLYKKEFGVDFELGFELSDFLILIDRSWKNDTCPSFYFKVSEAYYILWVDYADLKDRESPNARYLVQEAVNYGDDESPEIYGNEGSVIFESEDLTDLKQFLDLSQQLH